MFGFFTYSKRLNEVFADAVNAWIYLEDSDGLEIAVNAALTAVGAQRDSMITYAESSKDLMEAMFEDGQTLKFSEEIVVQREGVNNRLSELLAEIDRTAGDNLTKARMAMKSENFKVVFKAKVDYFKKRYPGFPLIDREE